MALRASKSGTLQALSPSEGKLNPEKRKEESDPDSTNAGGAEPGTAESMAGGRSSSLACNRSQPQSRGGEFSTGIMGIFAPAVTDLRS